MVSEIWAPTRISGLNEFLTPWGMSEMRAKRTQRISSSDKVSNSSAPRWMRPPSMWPGGRISLMRAMAMVDLPEPDSPTSPNRSPGRSSKSMPSTARTGPRSV